VSEIDRRKVMQIAIRLAAGVALGCVMAAMAGGPVGAQTTSVEVGVTANGPNQFRDIRTGTVWTPEIVGQDNRLSRNNKLEPSNQPSTPADPAFNPRAQIATAGTITVQRPRPNLMGTVPVTAGPGPVISIDGPSLQAIPGDRWLTALYITNNSAAAVDSQIGCTFTNGGRAVQEARVVVPTPAATRAGVPVYGPRTDVFVDRVLCRVLSP
jgi:hypothetical protein